MPYIPPDRREEARRDPSTWGELNYAIVKLIDGMLSDGDRVGYSEYNAIIGVLECCKLEIYRRLVAPYEDTKKVENGDVF